MVIQCGVFLFQAKYADNIPSEINSKIHLVDLAGRWVWKHVDAFPEGSVTGLVTLYILQ